jgi:hypothetical protein
MSASIVAASTLEWFKDLGIPGIIGVALGFGLNQVSQMRERGRVRRERLRERELQAAIGLDDALASTWRAGGLAECDSMTREIYEAVRSTWDEEWHLLSYRIRDSDLLDRFLGVQDVLDRIDHVLLSISLKRKTQEEQLEESESWPHVDYLAREEMAIGLAFAIENARSAVKAFLSEDKFPEAWFPEGEERREKLLMSAWDTRSARDEPGPLIVWLDNRTKELDPYGLASVQAPLNAPLKSSVQRLRLSIQLRPK